jgi:2-amino-4-hydroxy-6-hydroxymethyldihydropteridine diphosphokinase
MVLAYIGLGSNLNAPARQIEQALAALATLPQSRLLRHSALYASPPLGPPDQPDYLNAVAELETTLSPLNVLDALQAIEQAQGRVRGRHWGERVIDLDLLLYGDVQMQSERLTLPHAGMTERAFVLRPLAELVPNMRLPGGAVLSDLLHARAADVCYPSATPSL